MHRHVHLCGVVSTLAFFLRAEPPFPDRAPRGLVTFRSFVPNVVVIPFNLSPAKVACNEAKYIIMAIPGSPLLCEGPGLNGMTAFLRGMGGRFGTAVRYEHRQKTVWQERGLAL